MKYLLLKTHLPLKITFPQYQTGSFFTRDEKTKAVGSGAPSRIGPIIFGKKFYRAHLSFGGFPTNSPAISSHRNEPHSAINGFMISYGLKKRRPSPRLKTNC
jgi:hypothetical protein